MRENFELINQAEEIHGNYNNKNIKLDEYNCFTHNTERNMSRDLDYNLNLNHKNFDLEKIHSENHKNFHLPNQDYEFSDMSSISNIENNFNIHNNLIEGFPNDNNMKFRDGEGYLDFEEEFEFDRVEFTSNTIENNNKLAKSPIKKKKRQKEDLDKTPLPVFDCIFCSNQKVVFEHMVREYLSNKYLYGSDKRCIDRLNTILSTSITINNSLDHETQQMRNFIIYHTDYIKKFYDKKTILNFFETYKDNWGSNKFQPTVRKELFSNFSNSCISNTIKKYRKKKLNSDKIQIINNYVSVDVIKHHKTEEMPQISLNSPNFTNLQINLNTSLSNKTEVPFSLPQTSLIKIDCNENDLLKHREHADLNYKNYFDDKKTNYVINSEKVDENNNRNENENENEENADKNESFLKFLRFDLKRKINFEDILWEEGYHDIWDPNLSTREDKSQNLKSSDVDKSSGFMKLLNGYYKSKQSNEIFQNSFNENKSHTCEEETINMKFFSDYNGDDQPDKNLAEASGISIKNLISNFLENTYDKNGETKENISLKEKENDTIRNKENEIDNNPKHILSKYDFYFNKIRNKLARKSLENNYFKRNFSSSRLYSASNTLKNIRRPMSLTKYRLDSQNTLSDNSQSPFNSKSRFNNVVTLQSDLKHKYYKTKTKLSDVTISENVSLIKNEKEYFRLSTDYKKDKMSSIFNKGRDLKQIFLYSPGSERKTFSNLMNSSCYRNNTINDYYQKQKINLRKTLTEFKFSDEKSKFQNYENNMNSQYIPSKSRKNENLISPIISKINNIGSSSKTYAKQARNLPREQKNSISDLISLFKKKFRDSKNLNGTVNSNMITKSSISNSKLGNLSKGKIISNENFFNNGKESIDLNVK